MNKCTPLQALAGAVLLAAAGLASAADNLVVNGSFEQGLGGLGSFSAWLTTLGDTATFVDSSGQTGSHPGQASDGLWSAYFGTTQAVGGSSIAQPLTTVIGQQYRLSFDVANDNGGGAAANGYAVSVGGTVVDTGNGLAVQDYVHHQLTFTATSSSTLLSFGAFNDNGYLQLDNVAVTAVPEPGVAALLLLGLIPVLVRGQAGRRPRG